LILHPVVAELVAGLAESPLRAWAHAVLWILTDPGVQEGGLEDAGDRRDALVEEVLRDPAAFCGRGSFAEAVQEARLQIETWPEDGE
jgi:hypothetical protein